MKTRGEKHIPFFNLLEAFQLPGCPLCRLISGRTRRYFDNLLYEFVNDPGFRETWRKTRGFCHRHSWMLAEWGDGLGLSILYLDLVESHGADLLVEPAGHDCSICESEDKALKEILHDLNGFWAEPELVKAVSNSEGFCGPHLRAARRTVQDGAVRETLQRISIENLKRLGPQLRELAESYDYKHSSVNDKDVDIAWRRAIEKILGVRDLPGKDPPKRWKWKS